MNRATSPTGWARNPDGSPGYTWNPITGCLNHIDGLCKGGNFPCYAYKLANGRLKPLYLANKSIARLAFPQGGEYGVGYLSTTLSDPFYPRFWEERLEDSLFITKSLRARLQPRGIFVCDMGELFGDWIPKKGQEEIFLTIVNNPQHRFYLLTKQPQNLIKWSPFPDNCYVGVTATNWLAFSNALGNLATVKAKVKYLSLEPLLERIQFDMLQAKLFPNVINWLIIGACTGSWVDMANLCLKYGWLTLTAWGNKWTAQPKIEDLREIVEAADKAGAKIFLKDNLKPLIYRYPVQWAFRNGEYRQEMPEIK